MALRLGLRNLSRFCEQVGIMLDAGLTLRRALAVVERGAKPGMRSVCRRLGGDIEGGSTFSEALERQGRRFPLLLRRLVAVGETVGQLDAVLKRAARYYEFLHRIWTRLLISLIWPAMEYWGMIFVISAMTYLRGTLGEAHDPMAGARAGGILLIGIAAFCAPIALYFVATRILGGMRFVHEIMMRLPIIGMIMRTMALGRFAWCMEMMTAGGVRVLNAITWSLQATGNGVFIARERRIADDLMNGLSLSDALRNSKLFPLEFVEMLRVGEESGTMPEMFGRLARTYFERYEDALKVIGQVMFWLMWAIVAGVIIYFIFTIFMSVFGGVLELTRPEGAPY